MTATPRVFKYEGFKWQHWIDAKEVYVKGPLCPRCLNDVDLRPDGSRWYCSAAGCTASGEYVPSVGVDLRKAVHGKALSYYRKRGMLAYRHYPR